MSWADTTQQENCGTKLNDRSVAESVVGGGEKFARGSSGWGRISLEGGVCFGPAH